MPTLMQGLNKATRDTAALYLELLKVMVPITIVVRIGVELGMIETLSAIFTPFMNMAGLPPEAGIIWTTAMLVNIYAGMVTLVALLPEAPMTVAQLTVLGSMLLIAHSLPIEQRIVQKSGPSLIATTLLRILGALIYGAILHQIYSHFDLMNENVQISWLPSTSADANWLTWTKDSIVSLFWIFWVILALVILLRVLEALGVTEAISKALAPLLGLMGISEKAIPIIMVGVMLGLSYGGALIMKEARAGTMSQQDIFLSLSFMCLFHSLIEDTLLIYALGADLSGILIGRFIFAFLVLFILGRLVNKMPEKRFKTLLFKY